MKTGTQPSKPLMTARPPMPQRSQEDVLRDLEKVQEITESPARQAAQAVAEPTEGVGQSPVPVVPVVVAAALVKPKGSKEAMPWEQVQDEGTVSFNFKLPRRLAAKLKYVGDTTYGETMTSIVAAALEVKLEKMLKER
jgi:hypothetical protein